MGCVTTPTHAFALISLSNLHCTCVLVRRIKIAQQHINIKGEEGGEERRGEERRREERRGKMRSEGEKSEPISAKSAATLVSDLALVSIKRAPMLCAYCLAEPSGTYYSIP